MRKRKTIKGQVKVSCDVSKLFVESEVKQLDWMETIEEGHTEGQIHLLVPPPWKKELQGDSASS